MIILIALIAAGASSIIAGLFGSGAGIVAVPVLSELLKAQGIPNFINMHSAVGTTLAYSAIFMAVATYEQHKRKAVNWRAFKILLMPTLAGIIVGSIGASYLSSYILHLIFGLLLLALEVFTLFNRNEKRICNTNKWHFKFIGFLIAASVGIVGTGIITIPFLKKYGESLVNSIAMSVALGTVTASVGTIIYIISGLHHGDIPSSCFGYVSWYLLIPFIIGSVICAKVGVKLSHSIPTLVLHYLFSGFILFIALYMLVSL